MQNVYLQRICLEQLPVDARFDAVFSLNAYGANLSIVYDALRTCRLKMLSLAVRNNQLGELPAIDSSDEAHIHPSVVHSRLRCRPEAAAVGRSVSDCKQGGFAFKL